MEFDSDGTFLREIGHNLYAWSYAHTVKVDPQDNIWVTDKGSDVVKFNPEGRVSMVFGCCGLEDPSAVISVEIYTASSLGDLPSRR